MSTLAEIQETENEGAIHLLLAGPSKVGKTKYVTELIRDGFTVFYIDNDNGLNTLRKSLANDHAAMSRVHYLGTQNIWGFIHRFFARDSLQWNETKDTIYQASTADDDDKILVVSRKNMPFGVVIVIDSWTSLSNQLLRDSASKNQVDYEVFNEKGQAVFGDAKRRADVVCMNIQTHPGHVIVQAHQEQYEIQERPRGAMKDAKQGDMIIKQNVTIPYSVSRPHGFAMSKYFNEVGWLRVKADGSFALDFRQLTDRVGGGSPMKEGDPMKEMRFSKLFATPKDVSMDWIKTIPASVLKQAEEEEKAEKARRIEEAKAAKAAGLPIPAKETTLPSKGSVLGGIKK